MAAKGLKKYQKRMGIDRPVVEIKKPVVDSRYVAKPRKNYDSIKPMEEGRLVSSTGTEDRKYQQQPRKPWKKPTPVMTKNPAAKSGGPRPKPAAGFKAPRGMKPTAKPETIKRGKAKAPVKLMYRKRFNTFKEAYDCIMALKDKLPFVSMFSDINTTDKSDWELGQEMMFAIARYSRADLISRIFTTKNEINSYVYFKNNKVEYLINSLGGGLAFFWNYKKLEDGTVIRNEEEGHPVEMDVMISNKDLLAAVEENLKEAGFKLHEDTKVSRNNNKPATKAAKPYAAKKNNYNKGGKNYGNKENNKI